VIVTGDIHLTLETEPIVVEVFKSIKATPPGADGGLTLLGDIFDVRHVVHARLLSTFRDCLSSLYPEIDHVDIVVGNHDWWNLEGRNVLEHFERARHPMVHVHSEASTDGIVHFIPWASREKQLGWIRSAATKRPRPLLGHLAVRGAWMNLLRPDADGIDVDELRAFPRVLMAHYHMRHDVAPNIGYVGSPYQVSYAEAGQPKGLTVLDGLDLAGGAGTARFVELNVGPKHHKIVVDADHPQEIQIPDAKPGDKLWVCVRGQMAETLQATVQRTVAAHGLDVARFELDAQVEEPAARMAFVPGTPMKEIGVRYLEAQDVDPAYKALLLETLNRTIP
jgi:hypothetical protein